MTPSVAELDALPEAEAAFHLAACCGSSAWLATMLAQRPFVERERLLALADDAGDALEPHDWLEAFSHHPRIGERSAAADVSARAQRWSSGEQAASAEADADVRAALAEGNREYEERFGFIFIICAAGRPAAEILASLQERLGNAADTELAIAAREQQKITKLRLEKLVPQPADT